MVDRAFPLNEADVAPVIAGLLGAKLVRSEPHTDGRINMVRRVELSDGRVLGVKHYARGRSYAIEGAALRTLAGVVPVPEVVYTLDRVIAYRWIEGETLEGCRLSDPAALAGLAEPLGRVLGALARSPRDGEPPDLTPTLARLAHGPARERLGGALADRLARLLEVEGLDDATGFVHGELDAHAVIVSPGRDQIAGVIDWETATAGPAQRSAGNALCDVGSLLRVPSAFDPGFRAAFARGHGALPADWWWRARLVDATRLVAVLADRGPWSDSHAGLRAIIAGVVANYRR